MRRLTSSRLFLTLATACLILLVAAPAAFANIDGDGTFGENSDKATTNAGFMIIAFFPLLALVLSLVQWRLEKRKDARKAAAKRRASSAEWHGGW